MTIPKAIFLGLTLIALAIFFRSETKPAHAGFGGDYMMVYAEIGGVVFRIDNNGRVSLCAGLSYLEAPKCSPCSSQ